jgi:hypothetical protein
MSYRSRGRSRVGRDVLVFLTAAGMLLFVVILVAGVVNAMVNRWL